VLCDIILIEKKTQKKNKEKNKIYNYYLFLFIRMNFIFTSSW
jgi:hypothetical protein